MGWDGWMSVTSINIHEWRQHECGVSRLEDARRQRDGTGGMAPAGWHRRDGTGAGQHLLNVTS